MNMALQQFFRWLAAEDGIGDPGIRLVGATCDDHLQGQLRQRSQRPARLTAPYLGQSLSLSVACFRTPFCVARG
jgi:hypothetical protein